MSNDIDFQEVSPAANPNIAAFMEQRRNGVNGRQQKALALKRMAVIQAAKASGTAKPATILNFNPVALRLEGGLPYKVPSIVDQGVPEDLKLKFLYKGKTYRAHLLTITDPYPYPQITDVNLKQGEDMADGVGIYDCKLCRPIESVHHFWVSSHLGASDSSNMGGVIVFEGDKHRIWDAEKNKPKEKARINVPTFIKLIDNNREYFVETKGFDEVMALTLDLQKLYCMRQIQMASIYHNTEDQRKNITEIHRIWDQYSVDMGWQQAPSPWSLAQTEPEETCVCGAGKKNSLALLCHACARPYDPLKAYLAGEIGIDSVHMRKITKPEEIAIVRKHEKEMRARFADILGENEPPKK